MSKMYGIAISCTASDRLMIDEKKIEFFECISEKELLKIQEEKMRIY